MLYHWRRHSGSTASSTEIKPYAVTAGLRALSEAEGDGLLGARAEIGTEPNSFRVRYPVTTGAKASLIVCSRTPKC